MSAAAGVLLRIAVTLALLALLATQLGTAELLHGLRSLTPAVLAVALLLGLAATVCTALRWSVVARGIGAPVPLGTAVADTYRAQLLNSVLPAGMLGDAHRAVAHGLPTAGGRAGFRAVVLERAGGQVVVLLGCLALLAVVTGHPSALLVPVLLAAVVAVLYRTRTGPGAQPGLRGWLDDVRVVLLSRDRGPAVVILSLTGLGCHLALFVVAARTAGVDAPLPVLLPLLVFGLLAMAIPLNVGGWGPREGVTAGMFGAAALDPAAGFATAVLFGLLSLVGSLPGALTLTRSWRGHAVLRTDTVPDRRAP